MYTSVEQFKSMSNLDVTDFLKRSSDFLRSDYNSITSYFSGKSKNIDSQPFIRLANLRSQLSMIFSTIQSHSHKMTKTYWVDFIEQFEQIDDKFSTLQNIHKWTRSSLTNSSFSPLLSINYQLGQGETLENVSYKLLGQNNQDGWIDIAIDNDLSEIEYSTRGGESLGLKLEKTVSLGLKVNSIVDSLVGKSIYGKDIDSEFGFIDNDLKVLDYNQTMLQSVQIIIDCRKNDHIDYPELGLQSSVIVGSNRSLLNFPIIGRQLRELFLSDDSFKNFKLEELKLEQDNLYVSFQVETRLGEVQTRRVSL